MTYRNSLSRHALTGGRFQNDLHVNVLFGLYPRPFIVQPKFATICRRYNRYWSQVQMSNRRMASLYSNHHRRLSYAIGRFEPSPSLIQLSLWPLEFPFLHLKPQPEQFLQQLRQQYSPQIGPSQEEHLYSWRQCWSFWIEESVRATYNTSLTSQLPIFFSSPNSNHPSSQRLILCFEYSVEIDRSARQRCSSAIYPRPFRHDM